MSAFNTIRRWVVSVALVACGSAVADVLVIEGRDGWLFPVWENQTDVQKPLIDANLRTIAAVRDQLAEQNTMLLAVIVPMKASFYSERLPVSKPVSEAVKNRYAYVMTGLQAAHISNVDTLSVLRALEQNEQNAFFRTDYHWTAQGAEATAEAVAELIRQKVRFDKDATGGSLLGDWVNVRRYGDLATRFMTAEQRMKLRRDVFRVRAPPKEELSLLDDGPAEIHLVGNSFLQPYLGFPQKLSQSIGRPVSLTWKPGNFGPWATLLEYLESGMYRQNKPKVLVWQFNEPRMEAGPDAKNDWEAESLMSNDVWLSRARAAIAK